MDEIKDGGPAFPVQDASTWQSHGMKLRDYMAVQWLVGYVTSPTSEDMHMEDAAIAAYEMADAMLRAREVNHG